MAEVLVVGKKISEMELVTNIVGDEKIPTGVAGDKAVTTGQLLTYLDNNGKVQWGRVEGDIANQADLQNQFAQQLATLQNHIQDQDNPHNVTKEQVGLGLVDNTADMDKPVSTAVQEALSLKADQTYVDDSLANKTHNSLLGRDADGAHPASAIVDVSGVTQQEINDARVVAVDSIADLLALPEGQRKEGLRYLVKGYHAGSDIGGGEFYWVPNSTEEADGGTVFGAGESGRFYRVARRSEEWNVHWFGANGSSGSQNALPYLRAAFAAMPVGKTLFFPTGNYFVQSSTEEVLLEIGKNFNIRGESKRGANIQATASLPTATVIGINITDNSGFSDVRGWNFSSLRVTAGTAKHAVAYVGGMSLLSSSIRDCWLAGNAAAGGDGLHFPGYGLAHSRIEGCTLSSIYAAFGDQNVIKSNLFLGNRIAIVLDLQNGVRCTNIIDNTIVNRDGALHIINGDSVRFINNQCEQNQSYGMNQSTPSAMVRIEGRNRYCRNTVIRDNNFGGGTNVNYGLYIENAQRTVIDANHWISVNTAEIRITSAAKHTLVMPNQSFHGSQSNPRSGTLFKGRIIDDGVGSMGVLQSGDKATLYNDWMAGGFYKDASGVVRDIGGFSQGDTTEGSQIALLPSTYSPVIPSDPARINSLLWTQDFTNAAWTRVYTAVDTDDVVAPDGTMTADLVRHDTGGGSTQRRIHQGGLTLQNNSQYTISLYAKRVSAGTVDKIRMELTDGSLSRWVRVLLNLSTGAITASANNTYYPSSAITTGSEDVGAGWWRFWITFETLSDVAVPGSYRIGVTLSDVPSIYTAWEVDSDVNRAYLWGVQLNEGELGDYQVVEDADTFYTPSKSVAVSAMTEDGPGYVRINRQGLVTVGSLPSNKGVIISPFQSSVTTEPG